MPHVRAVKKHGVSLSLGQKAGMKDSLRNRSGSVAGRLKNLAGLKQRTENNCFCCYNYKLPAPLKGLLSNWILAVFVKVFPGHFVSEKISSTLSFKTVYVALLKPTSL